MTRESYESSRMIPFFHFHCPRTDMIKTKFIEQRVLGKPARRTGIAHGAVVVVVTAFAVVETQFSTTPPLGNLEVEELTTGSYL